MHQSLHWLVASVVVFTVCTVSAFGQGFSVTSDGLWNIRAFQIANGGGLDGDLNDTNETLGIWNVNPTGTGNIFANAKTYNINNYETDTENYVLYPGNRDGYTGSLAYASINGDGPGGSGGSVTGGDDFSILAQTYAAVPIGTWTLAAGSDDGRRIQFDTGAGIFQPSFTAAGGQLTNFTSGDSFVFFNGTTGHNYTTGVFTITAADVVPGTNVALVDLTSFMFERGGGDSFNFAIKNSADTGHGGTGDGWELLQDNTFGWRISSTPITINVATPGGDHSWIGGAGNWTNLNWENPENSAANTFTSPTGGLTGNPVIVPAGIVFVNGSQGAFSLNIASGTIDTGGAVNVNGGASLAIQDSTIIGGTGTLNINGTFSTFSLNSVAGSNVNLNSGGMLDIGDGGLSTIHTLNVSGPATLSTGDGLTITNLNMPTTLNADGSFTANNSTLSGGSTFNQTAGTATIQNVSGTGGLTKNGAGTVLLDTNNSYFGVTTINDGQIHVTNGGALGATGAGNQTLVNNGGALRLGGSGNITLANNQDIIINGNGDALADAAIFNQQNDNNIDGLITVASGSKIRTDNNRLRLRGGVAVNSGLNIDTDGGTVVEIQGNSVVGPSALTGNGTITKNGDGTLEIRTNSPNYSGQVNIANGVVDVNNQAQGLGTGGVNIDGDATLRLRSNVTLGNSITLNGTAGGGTGEGNQGRIRNDDSSNTLSGPIAWNANSRVQVDNGTTLTLSGGISGSGDINNDSGQTGRLQITNTGNTFSGNVNIGAGTVAFQGNGSTGNASGFNVSSGATLEVSNVGTVSGAANIAGDGQGGVGAVNNIGGTANFTGPLAMGGTSTTITSAAGTQTTFGGPVALGATTNVTFNSDGETTISQAFGNGNGNVKSTGLHFLGSEGAPRNNAVPQLNLDGNGGLMNGATATLTANGWDIDLATMEAHPDHRIRTLLTSGPGNRGLDFNGDGDFPVTSIVGNDDYNSLFIGTLTVSAADAGTWGFRREQGDDRESIWIDLDQDGVFELTGAFGDPGGGNNQRGEMLTFENGTEKTVTLAAGDYLFAVNHTEFGGGSQIDVNVRTPNLAQETINPTDPDQAGFWSALEAANNSVVINGNGNVRFDGDNNYNGTTDVNSGTLIINGNTTDQGDFNVASGATLGGNGTIGLQTGASVNVSGFPGTISPGDAGPGYPGGSPTFSAGTDMATVGTLRFNAASPTDVALNLDGILQLDVFSPTSADMIEAIQGTVDLDSTTSLLNINGETDFSQIDFGALGFQSGDELLLINAPDGLLGQFSNDAKDGDSFTDLSGQMFTFAQDGTSLRLLSSAVPEPTGIALWSLLGIAGWIYRRRLRK